MADPHGFKRGSGPSKVSACAAGTPTACLQSPTRSFLQDAAQGGRRALPQVLVLPLACCSCARLVAARTFHESTPWRLPIRELTSDVPTRERPGSSPRWQTAVLPIKLSRPRMTASISTVNFPLTYQHNPALLTQQVESRPGAVAPSLSSCECIVLCDRVADAKAWTSAVSGDMRLLMSLDSCNDT